MTYKNYYIPSSLAEAYELNQNKQNFILAGGMFSRLSRRNMAGAIDLEGLVSGTINDTGTSLEIGAMTTLRDLEQSKAFCDYTRGAAKDALSPIVGVQFRNTATLGGSLWGRYGFSDVLTLFATLDCTVNLYNLGAVPIRDFISMKPDRDILLGVTVEKTPIAMKYLSVRQSATDFPVLCCSAASIDGRFRAAVGARPGRAYIYESEMSLPAGAFAALAAEAVPTGSNMWGSAEYRKLLVKALINRCMEGLK